MKSVTADFTRSQWQLLTALHIFARPVPAAVIDILAPLPPGSLLALMKPDGPVLSNETGCLALSGKLPEALKKQLADRTTPLFARKLLDQLTPHHFVSTLDRQMQINLLTAARMEGDAIKLELELAREASVQGDYDLALKTSASVIRRLEATLDHQGHRPLFVATVLEFSNLAMLAGKALKRVFALLQAAGRAAEVLGDRRNRAMVSMHIGRILFLTGREREALAALEKGTAMVTALGDPDIREQASVFIGFFHFLRGHHKAAMEHLETALAGRDEREGMQFRPMARIVFGYTAAFIGHFHRSIGTLAFSCHLARQKRHSIMAAMIGAVLGIVLLAAGKLEDGLIHLERARQDALDADNPLGLNFATRGLAYYHFLKGEMGTAMDLCIAFERLSSREGFSTMFTTPWLLEMNAALELLSPPDDWQWRFEDTFVRIMQNPNIHIQGVALRLKAERWMAAGEPIGKIEPLLVQSEALLEKTGDPLQLAKSRFALARLHHAENDVEKSRRYARAGRRGIAGLDPVPFPDDLRDLRDLMDEPPLVPTTTEIDPQKVRLLADSLDRLTFKTGTYDFLNRVLFTLNRFLQYERSGIFWCENHDASALMLRAAHNLTRSEVSSESFAAGMTLIRNTFADGHLRLMHFDPPRHNQDSRQPRVVLCLPITVGETIRGVLYQDKSYLDDSYQRIREKDLHRIADCLGSAIARALEYDHLIEETRVAAIEKTVRATLPHDHELLAQSPEMLNILEQAGKVAATDASVLLQGETGTGKEILARWLHDRSRRHDKPFIVIEPAVLPEGLVEGELFGHERGAFTGADHQKTGLVELAHDGTLFIDEVSEIPPLIQVKLLRVLQEKTFTRVGGTKTIRSDFRLLAATNRELHREVAAGRFRKDLYYRLNVVELTLPPLRGRKKDIGFLARHFLSLYARKYNRGELSLTKKNESLLTGYRWPGNVRELQNVMERAVLLSTGNRLMLNLSVWPGKADHEKRFADLPTMDEMQWRYIQYVVEKTGGKIGGRGGAAEILGMKRTTLQARMQKLGRLAR